MDQSTLTLIGIVLPVAFILVGVVLLIRTRTGRMGSGSDTIQDNQAAADPQPGQAEAHDLDAAPPGRRQRVGQILFGAGIAVIITSALHSGPRTWFDDLMPLVAVGLIISSIVVGPFSHKS